MKQLIIVRHAKSDWGYEGLKDIDRPLNERGYSDAYALSKWFYTHQELPQLIVSSDATRALSTALIFSRSLDIPSERLLIESKTYEASSQTLAQVISNFDDVASSVMLFGHNPGLTNLVNELSNDLYFDNVPTCGIVAIQFEIKKWSEFNGKKGKLMFQQFPKEFKG